MTSSVGALSGNELDGCNLTRFSACDLLAPLVRSRGRVRG